MNHATSSPGAEPLRLGLLLTALQVAVYAGFVLLCCFDVPLLRADGPAGIPMSFVLGFGVIATGIVLTAIYVVAANHQEGSAS